MDQSRCNTASNKYLTDSICIFNKIPPMINGFVIEINNQKDEPQLLDLFRQGALPHNMSVSSKGNGYDYHALQMMACNKGFMGNGIATDDERITSITIYRKNIPAQYEFYKMLDATAIFINGIDDYISLLVPAQSLVLLQLIPTI